MSQQQQVFSDRYEMVRHVARGGMAQVYLARDLLLNRPVALKVLFPELSVDRSFVERFRREAQAAANLSHPNIVSVYDWGQGEHTYFIVMEYVDGRTLSSLIRQGPLDPAHAAGIGADVASALEFAHRHDVIHRDIKPGNVLIDNSGQVKVTDFGIARAAGAKEGLTQTGAVMGTATYFSPEQAQGHPVDARSDVYSLGVVLYEMVVGRPPFEGENPVSIAYQHVREEPVLPSVANPTVPKDFEAILMKAMAKRVEDRYESADALRADLLRFQLGQGVLAPEASTAMMAATRVGPPVDAVVPLTAANGIGAPLAVEDAELEAARRRRNRRYAGLLVLLLVVLAALVFFLGRALGLWGGADKLTVPNDLAGKSAAAAKAELTQAGFTNVTETNQASGTMADGSAIGTHPPGGSRLGAHDHLVLLVSSGPAPVAVPDVAGKTQAEAQAELTAKGFQVHIAHATSQSVAQGNVISTSPPGNQLARPGSTVTVTVSSGLPQVLVPPVAGKDPTSAALALRQAGLNPQQVAQSSSSVANGLVIGTDPGQGETVDSGSDVTMYVSTGPQTTTVPQSLVGETATTAENQLAAANLRYSVNTQDTTDQTKDGIVLSANPSPGSTQAVGTTITLAVGHYTPPTVTVPQGLVGESAASASSAVSQAGLSPSVHYQTVTNSAEDGNVLSVNPGSGTTVQKGSTVTLVVGQYQQSTSTTQTTNPSSTTTTSGNQAVGTPSATSASG